MLLTKLDRPPLIFQSVQEAIKAHILTEGIKPGEPLLPETELARQLGVSRNSVREAIKALESTGILESRRGSGVYVRAFSFEPLLDNLPYGLMGDLQDVSELLELRQVLELAKIEHAITCLTPQQLEAIAEVLEGMRARALAQESFPEEDRRFHHLLFQELGNSMLLKLLDVFWMAVSKAAQHINMSDPNPLQTYQDHVDIFEALKAKDPQRARQALDKHYEGIRVRLQKAGGDKQL
ncbi:MAG: FadR/GntR family transcriptional regulator [Deinococcales bacterium]